MSLVLTACAATQPVVKIGLVAPFEGRYRLVGYEAVYAARLAIREINAQGGVNGYRLELVALDDRGETDRAVTAARQLIADPQVVAVIGHYRPTATEAAWAEYCQARMPLVAIEITDTPASCDGPMLRVGQAVAARWSDDAVTFVSNVPDPATLPAADDFVKSYNLIPLDGTHAGPIALQTYDMMYLIFKALERVHSVDRAGLAEALWGTAYVGLGNKYAFDQTGNLIEGQTYVYSYNSNGQAFLISGP
ncbi:MAG: ABC transporter substrate-binding protein [Anaerolineae bacterium]